jgi:Replication-relaxation
MAKVATTDFPWSILPKTALEQVMASGELRQIDLELLRWQVWLSLLSALELTRVVRVEGQAFDEQTIRAHLLHLEHLGLCASVVLDEPGWSQRHHRYHITDLGLYALVRHYPESISVPKLATCYPVTRLDLLARLARPFVHLALSAFVTRLIAECPPGYQLTSYQQPWKHWYVPLQASGQRSWTCAAAFLLQAPGGTQHAFYVGVDQPESPFSQREAREWLTQLFALRGWQWLRGAVPPSLLLLSTPARFRFWAEQIERVTLQQNTSLPGGCITDYIRLAGGAFAPIWLPFSNLVESEGRDVEAGQTSILSLLDQPAGEQLVEEFAQYFTFRDLVISRTTGPLARRTNRLARYVGDSLQEEATRELQPSQPEQRRDLAALLSEELYGEKPDRLRIAALLNLVLSSHQKTLLAHLARHPHLTLFDLLGLLRPLSQDTRLVQRPLDPLLMELQLVKRGRFWKECADWHARERYQLTERGLRFLAMRQGLSPSYYLVPEKAAREEKKRISPRDAGVRWYQKGAWGLATDTNRAHTNALYRCVLEVIRLGVRSSAYRVLAWKSEHEAVLPFYDTKEGDWLLACPDAELLYVREGEGRLDSVLIEYDRGTTASREYEAKFEAYADYQRFTRTTLPPVLMVIQHPATAHTVRQAIHDVDAGAVPVVLVLESDLLQHGLAGVLPTP